MVFLKISCLSIFLHKKLLLEALIFSFISISCFTTYYYLKSSIRSIAFSFIGIFIDFLLSHVIATAFVFSALIFIFFFSNAGSQIFIYSYNSPAVLTKINNRHTHVQLLLFWRDFCIVFPFSYFLADFVYYTVHCDNK